MPRISLYSTEQRPVEEIIESRDFVAQCEIPDFEPLPEVVIWGERVFTQWADSRKYVEAFAFVVPFNTVDWLRKPETLFGKVMMKRYGG